METQENMNEVQFYLRKPQPTATNPKPDLNAPQTIYLKFKYRGQQVVYCVNEAVKPANWSKAKKRVKDNNATTRDGQHSINKLLDKLVEVLKTEYNEQLSNGIPTPATLKKHLDDYVFKNVRAEKKAATGHTLYSLIDRFIDGTIGDKKSDATITTYRTAKKHLEEFEQIKNYKVNFETINLDFKDAYVKFLSKDLKRKGGKVRKALGKNSVFKEIKNIKTFMNMAVEREYTTNIKHTRSSFGVESEDTAAVYLTEKELRTLYKFDFKDNKRLEAIRDLFVFQSFVGLRYSDASNIKPQNIVKIDGEDYIKITPQKTGSPVTIPCNDVVLRIFKKYEHNKNRLPNAPSNQKFNQYIKEVCQLAGLTETGRLESDMTKELWESISSHTARRSFATNCYLDGMDDRMIMAVTGHKTEKAFKQYIKVSREENAKRMQAHMKKGSIRNLKAVS
jgi:integrase